jgi:DNA-binding transcriptional LysR family regulator
MGKAKSFIGAHMDLKWIEDFMLLAQTRSFSRTAEERGITQPALSRRIKSLEAWVGTELVDRSVYPARLTSAGKYFQEQGSDFLRHLFDTRALLREKEGPGAAALKIAAGHSLALNFIPQWLHAIQAQAGEMNTRVIASNVHDSVLELVEGSCDLLISYHHPELPIVLDPGRYEYRVIDHDTVVPVSAAGPDGRLLHRLPGSKTNPVHWLAYTETSYLGRIVDWLLKSADQRCFLYRRHESNLSEFLKTMALQKIGLAWVPRGSTAHELTAGQLAIAAESSWTVRLEIRAYRALETRHPSLERLWGVLHGPE